MKNGGYTMWYDRAIEIVTKYGRIADFLADAGFVIAVFILCPMFLIVAYRLLRKIEINTRS